MKQTKVAIIVAALGVLLVASSALAQGTVESAAEATNAEVGFEFDDDPFSAGGIAPDGTSWRGCGGIPWSFLMRPRISFEEYILRSVENL